MTYIYPPETQDVRETNVDSFNRIRVSELVTLLEFKQTKGTNAAQLTTSGGTRTLNATDSSSTLSVSSNQTCTLQTIGSACYEPGKSLLLYITGVLDTGTNASDVISRLGFFDNNNGVFFEYENSILYATIRKNGTDTRIAQSSWNGSSLPNTIDATKSQIFGISMTWLGVGSVNYYIYQNGMLYTVHTENHANIIDGTYTRDLNSHIRFQIISPNGGGTGSMKAICGNVCSEGGYLPNSIGYSASRGNTGQTITSGGTEPVIAIQLKSTGSLQNSDIRLQSISCITIDNVPYLYNIWFCPPGQGTLTTPTWVSAGSESAIEYDVSSTTFSSTGCLLVHSGYNTGSSSISVNIPNDIKMGFDVSGTNSTKFVLEITNITGTNKSYFGAMNWSEYF